MSIKTEKKPSSLYEIGLLSIIKELKKDIRKTVKILENRNEIIKSLHEKINQLILLITEDRKNEEKLFNFCTSIQEIENFSILLNIILQNAKDFFDIPNVWINLVEEYPFSKKITNPKIKKINETIFLEIIKNSKKPILDNRCLKKYRKLYPKNPPFITSIAIIPIVIKLEGENKIIGSLNFGHTSLNHFSPKKETILLEHLGKIISLNIKISIS